MKVKLKAISPKYDFGIIPGEVIVNLGGFPLKRLNVKTNKEVKLSANFKCIQNAIFAASAAYGHCQPDAKLQKMGFLLPETGKDTARQLLSMQARHFRDVDFVDIPPAGPSAFSGEWVAGIRRILTTDVVAMETIKQELIQKGVSGEVVANTQFYQAVSMSSPIQARCWGYQWAQWERTTGWKAEKNPGTMSLADWGKSLVAGRVVPHGKYYDTKVEHYLESKVLERLWSGGLQIGQHRLVPLFGDGVLNFQFPALLFPGESQRRANNPVYIDVLAKVGNRPAILELKVWERERDGKKGKNTRGQYVFWALAQVLGYYSFLRGLAEGEDQQFQSLPGNISSLDWKHPVLILMVNSLGSDEVAKSIRESIASGCRYLSPDLALALVEFDDDVWQAGRKIADVKVSWMNNR